MTTGEMLDFEAQWEGPHDEHYFAERARVGGDLPPDEASDQLPPDDDRPEPPQPVWDGGTERDEAPPTSEPPQPVPDGTVRDEGTDWDGAPPTSKADVVAIARLGELFHAPDGTPYATFEVNGHRQTWRVASAGFKDYLRSRYYAETGKVPGGQAFTEALGTIAGIAKYDGEQRDVFLRVGQHDGTIYLDLCDDEWRAVEIRPEGWRIVSGPPVRFRRTSSMLPLPVPVSGNLDDLRRFVNVSDDDAWRLLVGWMVYAFSPDGPYPVLVLHGEQGSAKSTAERLFRSLIDPSSSPLRATPKDHDDLMVACVNGWVIALDNLSTVQDWLSDALCRVATGSGLSKRMLYTDSDETVLNACRPVMLNGINELATRGDLLDRSVLVDLEPIPPQERRTERHLWAEFERVRPGILGALLDAVVAALRNRQGVRLDRLPRMADFAVWVTAAEESLGWEPGAFLTTYEANRRSGHDLALDASMIGAPIRAFMARHEEWTGTAAELREELAVLADERSVRSKFWPGNAWAMSNALNRHAPNLRAVGVEVERARKHGGSRDRLITLRRVRDAGDAGDETAGPSRASEEPEWPQVGGSFVPSVPSVPEQEHWEEYGPSAYDTDEEAQ